MFFVFFNLELINSIASIVPIEEIILLNTFIFDKDDLQKMNVLRRIIAPMGSMEAIEFISSKLKNTKNNAEFFNSMNKPS